jgi:hypothetical protein
MPAGDEIVVTLVVIRLWIALGLGISGHLTIEIVLDSRSPLWTFSRATAVLLSSEGRSSSLMRGRMCCGNSAREDSASLVSQFASLFGSATSALPAP